MKQPDDIFSQMLPFWEHLTPQEQMAPVSYTHLTLPTN